MQIKHPQREKPSYRTLMYGITMNDMQESISALRAKGWTLAAIADALGVSTRAVQQWKAGLRYPGTPQMVLDGLEGLMKRKDIPKRRRYAPGSRRRTKLSADSE